MSLSIHSITLNVHALDKQHLTEALVAVEDLNLSLHESSIGTLEELLFIPNLRGLTLNVVSDHVSSLSIASPPPVRGVGPEWSLSLVCRGSCCVYVHTFSSQQSFNDLETSPHPPSVSGVGKLRLTFPHDGDTILATLIQKCPHVEELTVECNNKGKEECICM